MQKLSASRVLSEAFEIFKARFVPMVLLTLGYYLMVAVVFGTIGITALAPLLTAAATGQQPADPRALIAGMGGGIALLYLAVYALNFWHQAAMCRLTSDRHGGSLGDAAKAGLHAILPLFGVVIVALVAVGIGSLAVGLIIGIAAAGADSGGLGAGLGLIALLGAIYVALRCSMILPAIAIEDVRNPLTAFSRSWAMTQGSVLKLFAVFVIVFGAMGLAAFALIVLTVGIPAAGAMPGTGTMIAFVIAMVVLGLSIGIYLMAVIGAIHRQLGGQSVAEVEATFA